MESGLLWKCREFCQGFPVQPGLYLFLPFWYVAAYRKDKKCLRILPVLPLTKRLPFCIWNARRKESILLGQSLLLPQHTKFRYILFFPTRTTQIEDNTPLNISSTRWEHCALLHYAAIDLNIYTIFSSLYYHYKTNIWSSLLIRDTHVSTDFIDLTYISGTTRYLVRFIFGWVIWIFTKKDYWKCKLMPFMKNINYK